MEAFSLKEKRSSGRKDTPQEFGALIFLVLIVVFFILRIFEHEGIRIFLGLNFIILLGGVYLAEKSQVTREEKKKNPGKYTWIKFGFYTSFFGVLFFSLFLLCYLFADYALQENLSRLRFMGLVFDPVTASAMFFTMSLIGGLVFSFITRYCIEKYNV